MKPTRLRPEEGGKMREPVGPPGTTTVALKGCDRVTATGRLPVSKGGIVLASATPGDFLAKATYAMPADVFACALAKHGLRMWGAVDAHAFVVERLRPKLSAPFGHISASEIQGCIGGYRLNTDRSRRAAVDDAGAWLKTWVARREEYEREMIDRIKKARETPPHVMWDIPATPPSDHTAATLVKVKGKSIEYKPMTMIGNMKPISIGEERRMFDEMIMKTLALPANLMGDNSNMNALEYLAKQSETIPPTTKKCRFCVNEMPTSDASNICKTCRDDLPF